MAWPLLPLLCLLALAPLSRAGAPEDVAVLLYLSAEEPREVYLGVGTTYLEVDIAVPKYMLSFSNSSITIEANTEGVPENPVPATQSAEVRVVLQQDVDGLGTDWVDLVTATAFNFTDRGYERYFAMSLKVGNYSSGRLHRLMIQTSSAPTIVLKLHVVCMGNYGIAQAWLGLVVLVITYGIISFELAERALMGLAAAFVTLLLLKIAHKEYSLETVATWLDQSTFVLLFGMMIIVKIFGDTGFFEWIAVQAIRLSRGSVRVLFVLICSLTAFLSAFLDNVTTVLLSAPITVKVCEVLEVSPVPFLIGQALMSNIGGTATLIGDPPNIIIGSMLKEYVTFNDFIIWLGPCVVVTCVVCQSFLLWWYRHSVAGRRQLAIEEIAKEGQIKEKVKFIKCCIILGIVLIAFFISSVVHIEPAWIALAGANALMLLTYPKHIETPLTGVEWNTLVFFGALFVMVRGMEKLGLIRLITNMVAYLISATPPAHHLAVAITLILWVAALVSAIISSIPTTTTLIPVIVELAADPTLNLTLRPLIWSLAFGACFGGNGTLIGAAANVVVAGIVRSKGYFVTFINFTKVGFPTMIISTIMANAWCLIIFVAIGAGRGTD
jgi:Na+/H+ antiporter NhaD/arsenite permease-like protein